jgi:hypothetical protein
MLLTLTKRALAVLALGLWGEQFWECAAHPAWLTPGLDQLLDSVMITLSVIVIAWVCTEYIIKAMGTKATALASFIDATSARAAPPVGPRDSGAHPKPHLVEDRDSA